MTTKTAPSTSPTLQSLGTIFMRVAHGEKVPPMVYAHLSEEVQATFQDHSWAALERIIDALPADRRSDAAYQISIYSHANAAQAVVLLDKAVTMMTPSDENYRLLMTIAPEYVGDTVETVNLERLKKVMETADRFPLPYRRQAAHNLAPLYEKFQVTAPSVKAWAKRISTAMTTPQAMSVDAFAIKVARLSSI